MGSTARENFHADHSLAAGRAVDRGYRIDGHARDLSRDQAKLKKAEQQKKRRYQSSSPRPNGGVFCCVPSMNDSLEVEVLYPA
jgi:hypothetical protein